MEDGLLNRKVVFIIQARMKSTRLPGKIIMPLPLGSGKPLLTWIIDELKKSKYFNKNVLATSVNPENDLLIPFCENHEISYFRGDENNVLSRFTTIVRMNQDYDCVVRLTADNPIIDVSILDKTIEEHFKNNNDYTRTDGLPVGMNFEIVSTSALLETEENVLTDADKEHVTLYVRNNERFKKSVFDTNCNPKFKELRLTVDYASDYSLVSTILSQSEVANSKFGIQLVEDVFNKYQWIFETNSSNIQKKQFIDCNEEIKEACAFLKSYDFNHAATTLEMHVK